MKKKINTDLLKKTHLTQLVNDGLIDEQLIEKGKNRYCYTPVIEDFDDFLITTENEEDQSEKGSNEITFHQCIGV
jgi:hypothetical protein